MPEIHDAMVSDSGGVSICTLTLKLVRFMRPRGYTWEVP